MTPETRLRLTKTAVWILRLAVGGIFIVSGAAKMTDPYGFIYKINDYLAAWHLSVSKGPVVFTAVLLSATEFLTGVTLATGSMRRLSVWVASAMMAFMLPLTLYVAIADPVADCGCFGDLWIISNWATFFKNIAIAAGLAALLLYNRRIEGLFTPMSQWMQITLAAGWIGWVGLVGYNEQPLLDFRPYPVGSPLLHEADSSEIIYRYASPDGTTADFPASELPDEGDGQWTFVERIDPDGGVTESAFAVFDSDGADATYDLIGATDRQLLMLVPDVKAAGISETYVANELARHISSISDNPSASFAAIVSATTDQESMDEWLDLAMADYPVYTAEDTAIKTVARGKMALVFLRNDTVIWKRTLASINPDQIEAPDFTLEELRTDGPHRFRHSLMILLLSEIVVMLMGRGATFSRLQFIRSRRKARANS